MIAFLKNQYRAIIALLIVITPQMYKLEERQC